MRVVKNADERRNEILDVANELFGEKGYDNTSVADILNKVGIAKGTLYYYFKSKEEIMNGIIERATNIMFEKANDAASNSKLSIPEKILNIIMSLNLEESQGQAVMKHIHSPQNALMHQKQLSVITKGVTPILAEVIKEGMKEGVFQTDFPYEGIEMIIIYVLTVFDDMNEMSRNEFIKKMLAFIYHLERILGTEPGYFSFVSQLFQ